MKKILLFLTAAVVAAGSCFAFQKALYVKKGDTFAKFNFGVAGDLKFGNNGHTLSVTGYDEVINLDDIDYISFTAPSEGIALTPDQQKARLISIGKDINAAFNINEEADMVRLFDEFLSTYENVYDIPVSDYQWPEGYGNFGNGNVGGLIKSTSNLIRGNASEAVRMVAGALEVHKASDFAGIFRADHATHSWTKVADADYFEIRYRSDGSTRSGYFVVRISWSQQANTWNTADYSIETPNKFNVTFLENDKELATMTIDVAVEQDRKIDIDFNFKSRITQATGTVNMLPDGISFVAKESYNGKEFSNQKGHVDGRDLLDYDKLKEDFDKALTKEYYDDVTNTYEVKDGDLRPLISHFLRGHVQTDVLGKLQAQGRMHDFAGLHDRMKTLSDYDESGEITLSDGRKITTWGVLRVISLSDDKKALEYTYDAPEKLFLDVTDFLNNKSDVQFAYDGTGITQGFLEWDINSQKDEYGSYAYLLTDDNRVVSVWKDEDTNTYKIYDNLTNEYVVVPADMLIFPVSVSEVYMDIAPKLVFSDLTSFFVEDFFTKQAFGNNIDDYNALIDAYYSITGHNRISGYVNANASN